MPKSFRDGKISLLPEPLLHSKLTSGLRTRVQLQSVFVKLRMRMHVSPCAFVLVHEVLLLKVKWQFAFTKLSAKISE